MTPLKRYLRITAFERCIVSAGVVAGVVAGVAATLSIDAEGGAGVVAGVVAGVAANVAAICRESPVLAGVAADVAATARVKAGVGAEVWAGVEWTWVKRSHQVLDQWLVLVDGLGQVYSTTNLTRNYSIRTIH